MHKKHPWFCLKEETGKGSSILNVKKKTTQNIGLCKKTIYLNTKNQIYWYPYWQWIKTDMQDDENGTETHLKGNTTFS